MTKRVTRLDTIGGIYAELGRIYRLAKNDKMRWDDAKSATYVLKEMRAILADNNLDQKLAELDERITALAVKSNGGGHPQTERRL